MSYKMSGDKECHDPPEIASNAAHNLAGEFQAEPAQISCTSAKNFRRQRYQQAKLLEEANRNDKKHLSSDGQ